MSDQIVDLRGCLRMVRRYWALAGIIAALGLAAGVALTLVNPPKQASTALVVLPVQPVNRAIATQVVIAGSDPVLSGAVREMHPPVSVRTLRSRIQVTSLTPSVISITGQGRTAAQAESAANAVAGSYVGYLGTDKSAVGKLQARILQRATEAAGTSAPGRLLMAGGLGALLGALIGAIVATAVGRNHPRLRGRDEMAAAIGVPVLASLPVWHPRDAARWTRLVEEYEPSVAHASRLRSTLKYLGLPNAVSARASNGGRFSVSVLSLSSDRGALALGPQLASFGADIGITTALVIDSQRGMTPTLRAACTARPSWVTRSGLLHITLLDRDKPKLPPDVRLTVNVAVVDDRRSRVADTMRTTVTLLGVSAGAATAEKLARVLASAEADGRRIAGILLADPDPADHTTGRIPMLARSARRIQPSRVTGMTIGGRIVNGSGQANSEGS